MVDENAGFRVGKVPFGNYGIQLPMDASISGIKLGDLMCGQKIGEGTYGTVHLATIKDSNKKVAIKQIKINGDKEGVPSTCLREVTLLKELSHPNIVELIDVIIHRGEKLYLVFEYVDQDMKHLFDKVKPRLLPLEYVKSFVFQLLQGLAYIHSHRVVHRDLKPQNILVGNNCIVKLADFGLARSFSIPSRCYTHEVVTMWYRAPEVLLGTRTYSTGIDIWSLGCIFAEMVTLSAIFHGDCEIDQIYQIFHELGTPNEETWPGVEKLSYYNGKFPQWKKRDIHALVPGLDPNGIDLLKQMLIYKPMWRITAKSALSHRYLRDVSLRLDPIPVLLRNFEDEQSPPKKKQKR